MAGRGGPRAADDRAVPTSATMIRKLSQLDVRLFNRACAAVALAFLLIAVMGKYIVYERRGIEQTADFGQYYMGGVMALRGEWDALYPSPRPGAVVNAGF